MAIVTPMTYTALESLIGDFLQEPGAPVAIGRYVQEDRQRGIVWAEIQALRHLPEDDCRNLIFTEGIATDASGIIITTELAPVGEERFFDAIDIYNIALTPDTHFIQISREDLRLRNNRNYQFGHHWYYVTKDSTGIGQKRQIQLMANTDGDYKSITDSSMFMTFKVFPSSYQGTFGSVLVPFERNEELIAMGAAGFVAQYDDEVLSKELLQKFYQGIGLSDDSARRN